MNIELVVAHFQEDLRWLRNIPPVIRQTVYTKGITASEDERFIRLLNVGREAHTYLTHLVNRYDSLADYTVFCQGKPFDHAYNFHHILRNLVNTFPEFETFSWIGHLIDTDDWEGNRLFKIWSKNPDSQGLNLREFHTELFDTEGPETYTFVLGGQFGCSREFIRSRPIEFYEKALRIAENFPDAAHCFERCWDQVFGIRGISEEILQGRETVFLKPMKKQVVG